MNMDSSNGDRKTRLGRRDVRGQERGGISCRGGDGVKSWLPLKFWVSRKIGEPVWNSGTSCGPLQLRIFWDGKRKHTLMVPSISSQERQNVRIPMLQSNPRLYLWTTTGKITLQSSNGWNPRVTQQIRWPTWPIYVSRAPLSQHDLWSVFYLTPFSFYSRNFSNYWKFIKTIKTTSHGQKQEPDYNLEWSLGGFILNFHVLFYSFLLPIN